MNKTYVYANIKLPILINENEDLEPLSEYLTIEFESCDKLPPKPEKEIDYSVIIEKLRAVGGNLRFSLGGNLRFPPSSK